MEVIHGPTGTCNPRKLMSTRSKTITEIIGMNEVNLSAYTKMNVRRNVVTTLSAGDYQLTQKKSRIIQKKATQGNSLWLLCSKSCSVPADIKRVDGR